MSREPSQRLNSKDQIRSVKDASYFNELYQDQLEWTTSTRKHLFRQMNLFHAKRILEVGSGTGAILREVQTINSRAELVGLDLNFMALNFSRNEEKLSHLILGKGESLPFKSESFDITLCHYFLMWLKDPVIVLREMKRVTRVGGWISCLAEPDYGGRLDFPASELWNKLLLESLSAPNPLIGRMLRTLFFQINLKAQVGLQSVVLSPNGVNELYEVEIDKLTNFLPEKNDIELKKLRKIIESHDSAELFSFMPVFFALARNSE